MPPDSEKVLKRAALVTGASKGIGRGIAIGLAEAGWDVGVNYHQDLAGAEATASSIRSLNQQAWVLQADVGSSEQVLAMFGQWDDLVGPLDLLVNNAAIQTWSPLLDLAEEDWDRTLRTNLKGTFLCMQSAAVRMAKDSRGGSMINIGSGANKIPFPGLGDYCTSKGGIESLTKQAAVEWGPLNIRVNCVAPGSIEVERTQKEDPTYREKWAPLTPLRNVGQVEDVAHAVVYLACPKARFITGQTLYIDGGLWTGGPWPYKQ